MKTEKVPANWLDNSSPANVKNCSIGGDNTSSCHRDRIGMLKRTWALYILWLIQIFSAINTFRRGRGCCAGCDDVRACRSVWRRRRMRAIASVSACHRLAIVGPVADIRAPAAPAAPDLSMSRTPQDALSPPNKAHSHATERTRTLPYLNGTIVSHSVPQIFYVG